MATWLTFTFIMLYLFGKLVKSLDDISEFSFMPLIWVVAILFFIILWGGIFWW